MKKPLLLFLLFSTLVSCQLKSDGELTKAIETNIKANPRKIDFAKICEFDFDQLIILEPYSNVDNVQKKLMLDFSNIIDNRICNSDDIYLIVFISKNKSVKVVELNRANGDFKDCNVLIKSENALFKINDHGNIALLNL